MQRKFIVNLGLLLFLNFLIKPFWIFGIDREVQVLFPYQYGTYFALFNFSLLFNIILDIGITNFNNRNIARNGNLLTNYFSGIVMFKLLLAIVYAVITFIAGYVMGYDSDRFHMLLFLSINQFLVSFIQYLRSNISGLQLFTLDGLLSVLDKMLMILFCAVLIWGNLFSFQFSLMHFIYAQTCAYVIAFLIVFVIVLLKSQQFTFKVDKQFMITILKQTFPYALLVLTMTFYSRMDAVMLDMMLEDGEMQASIYAQAYRLMDASNQVGVLFASLLLPMFAAMIKGKKKIDELVKLSFSLLFVPAVVLAIICFFFSNKIMDLLYVVHIDISSNVLVVLMVCFVAIACTYIFGTLLTANGNLRSLNKIALFGLAVNFVLNIILIPRYEVIGSAYATLVTQLLVVFCQIMVAKRIFDFKNNYLFLLRILIFVLLTFGLIIIIKYGLFSFVSQIIISVLGSLLIGVSLKVIDLKEVYKILVEREL